MEASLCQNHIIVVMLNVSFVCFSPLPNEVHNRYKASCLCVLGYTFCERIGRTVKELYLAGCLTQKTSQAE